VTDRRRPRWIYAVGSEPDARFSLANERTMLAWVRTSLALLAGGVAVQTIGVPAHPVLRAVLVALLAAAGLVLPPAAFVRWARAERALRTGGPLPAATTELTVVVLLVVAAGLVAFVGSTMAS